MSNFTIINFCFDFYKYQYSYPYLAPTRHLKNIPSQDPYNQEILNLHREKKSTPQYDPTTLIELITFFNNCLYPLSSLGIL